MARRAVGLETAGKDSTKLRAEVERLKGQIELDKRLSDEHDAEHAGEAA